jgi:hypothetical protein
MGWHDVVIHGLTCSPSEYELTLDIDYIFEWVQPEPPAIHYSFWIAPATLVFRNVSNFEASLDGPLGFQIMELARENPREPVNARYIESKIEWTWTVNLLQGEFKFWSVGYSQYTRRRPIRAGTQYFSLQERGGINFDRPEIPLIP